MHDPGPDRHGWESEWRALEPLVVDSPGEALPELDDLVGRMMAERGYPLAKERASAGEADPEVAAGFRVAREIARRVEQGDDVDPGEVGQAVGLYRELYEHLLARGANGA